MPYDFSVDKKTGLLLLTGYVLVSFLLFVAGFLFGLNYGLSSKVAEILARSGRGLPYNLPSGRGGWRRSIRSQKPMNS